MKCPSTNSEQEKVTLTLSAPAGLECSSFWPGEKEGKTEVTYHFMFQVAKTSM